MNSQSSFTLGSGFPPRIPPPVRSEQWALPFAWRLIHQPQDRGGPGVDSQGAAGPLDDLVGEGTEGDEGTAIAKPGTEPAT